MVAQNQSRPSVVASREPNLEPFTHGVLVLAKQSGDLLDRVATVSVTGEDWGNVLIVCAVEPLRFLGHCGLCFRLGLQRFSPGFILVALLSASWVPGTFLRRVSPLLVRFADHGASANLGPLQRPVTTKRGRSIY